MISKYNQVMIFYLMLIVLFAFLANKYNMPTKNDQHNMLAGAGAGLLLSLVLWFIVGKKYADK
jgi:hypothetical protein